MVMSNQVFMFLIALMYSKKNPIIFVDNSLDPELLGIVGKLINISTLVDYVFFQYLGQELNIYLVPTL